LYGAAAARHVIIAGPMTDDTVDTVSPGRLQRLAGSVSPWVLALVVLGFLLPFVSVSCAAPAGYGSGGGGVTASYSGMTLASGGGPKVQPPDRELAKGASRTEDSIDVQPMLLGALILLLGAVALVRHRNRACLLATALLSGVAAVLTVAGVFVFASALADRVAAKLDALHVTYNRADLVAVEKSVYVLVFAMVLVCVLNLVAGLRAPV
jgi:hypothetical protein